MAIREIILIGAGIYILIAILVFIFNASIGPVTPGLALLRGALWPLTFMGMIPGERMRMD